jgi:hypothetical protein
MGTSFTAFAPAYGMQPRVQLGGVHLEKTEESMKTRIEWLMVGVALCAAALGCNKSNDREVSEPAMAENDNQTAATSETMSATNEIAKARCVREEKCENIGANKKYSSMDDCKATVRNDWREDLNARECANGVNDAKLEDCLAEIKNEDCNNALDSLSRMSACMKAEICRE